MLVVHDLVDDVEDQRRQRDEGEVEVGVTLVGHVGREAVEQSRDQGRRVRRRQLSNDEQGARRRQREGEPHQGVVGDERAQRQRDGREEQGQERHDRARSHIDPTRIVDVRREERVVSVKDGPGHVAEKPRLLHVVATGAVDEQVRIEGIEGPVGTQGQQQECHESIENESTRRDRLKPLEREGEVASACPLL